MPLPQNLNIPPQALTNLDNRSDELLRWYRLNKREMPWRSDPTPYHVWISEIMLQQTRVEAVRGYYDRFLQALPDIESLARAPEDQLLKLWEGLGYYNRARNLQKAARIVMDEYGGELPATYNQLQTLPGIGAYTAGAIASIAFGLPEPAPDGNVYRVLTRLLGSDANIDIPQTRSDLAKVARQMIPPQCSGDFNQSLMELGAIVCLPTGAPLCSQCPWQESCVAYKQDSWSLLPVRQQKKPRRIEERTILLLLADGKLLLAHRPGKGLLAGLPEPINLEGHLNTHEIARHIVTLGGISSDLAPLGKAKHIFTHVEWRMIGYAAHVQIFPPPEGYFWADKTALRKDIALPSAFRSYMAELPGLLAMQPELEI